MNKNTKIPNIEMPGDKEEKDTGKSKKKRKSKLFYNICMFVLFAVFAGCCIYLVRYFLESKKSEDRVDELRTLIAEDDTAQGGDINVGNAGDVDVVTYVEVDGVSVQKKFEELYRLNHDFIGWISIDGMVIDYPVMQTPDDEEFYLYKDFDKKYSRAGTPFIDTESDVKLPSDNLMIYGHYMQSGKMFHDLEDYEDEAFYEKHKYISFDTIYGNGTYEVIAAFRSQIYAPDYTGFKYYQFFNAEDREAYDSYVANCKALTPYDIPVTAVYGDKLITLSTCAYHTENGRYVVVAKKISE